MDVKLPLSLGNHSPPRTVTKRQRGFSLKYLTIVQLASVLYCFSGAASGGGGDVRRILSQRVRCDSECGRALHVPRLVFLDGSRRLRLDGARCRLLRRRRLLPVRPAYRQQVDRSVTLFLSCFSLSAGLRKPANANDLFPGR